MTTYNLKAVEEATIVGTNINTYYIKVPIDDNGLIPDYLTKDRVIVDDQMLVFDTHQEYLDYINQVNNSFTGRPI
jgi:hypothetical protein